MGYGFNRISPITFDEDAFQTPDNRTQSRALTSMPQKKGKQSGSQVDQQCPSMNKTYSLKQVPRQEMVNIGPTHMMLTHWQGTWTQSASP